MSGGERGSVRRLGKRLARHWFLPVLFAVVAFGYFVPRPGMLLKEDVGMRPFIVSVLFVMSLSLKTGAITRSFLNFRGLGIALAGQYLALPCLLYLFGRVVFGVDSGFFVAMMIVAAVPCTLASAAIWTRLSGGNDALALASTIVTNLVSFAAGPLVLWLTLSVEARPEVLRMMRDLFLVIVLPVGAGQLARIRLGGWADRHRAVFSSLGRAIILAVVLIAVSRASISGAGQLGAGTLGTLIGLLVLSHCIQLAVGWGAARGMKLPREDSIAAMFASSQKTLPAGMYLASVFFSDYKFAPLGILFYHTTQLIVDSVLVEKLRGKEE